MSFLKKQLLKLRLSMTSGVAAGERKPVTYSKANHIGVLIYLSDPGIKTKVEDFVSEFIREGKKTEAICFSEKPTLFRFNFPCQYFSLKDMDWKGDFQQELINKFVKTPFDYLYSINILPILPFRYILRKSAARCRVGKFEERADLDLMLQIPGDKSLSFLMDQMRIYSKKISTDE